MPIGSLTPTKIQLNVEKAASVTINGLTEYTFYVNCQEYKELPLDANVREPDVQKSRPYKDMINTLSSEPEKFLENNLGISVIASSVVPKSSSRYELTFPSGTGILNGGHTQRAILDSQSDPNISHAIVKISVREKSFTPQRIAEIASAQNSSTAVKEYSLAEKKGYYAEIKAKMDPDIEKHIRWYEGKTVSGDLGIEPPDLISFLTLFDILDYKSSYNSMDAYPNSCFSSKKTVFTKWVNSPSHLKVVYPLVNDILRLSEHIELTFTDKTGLARLQVVSDNKSHRVLPISGKEPERAIPKSFLYAALSAFRANVYYDAPNDKIGWLMDPTILYANIYVDIFKRIANAYKSSYKNDVKKVGTDSMLWAILYTAVENYIKANNPAGKVFVEYDI